MIKDLDYVNLKKDAKAPFGTKKKKSPSIFLVLISISIFIIFVSWIVFWTNGADPTGVFHPAGILEIISAPMKGFIASGPIIAFLFVMAAFLKIVNDSKALESGIGIIFSKLKGKESWIIAIMFFVFMICGTTFNFCEQGIVFYSLLIPVLIAVGFDSLTALLVICYGAGVGCCGSTVNPMLINNAIDAANKGIAGLYPNLPTGVAVSTSDGIVWRILALVVLATFSLSYILWYANRVKKDPSKSYVYDSMSMMKTKYVFNTNSLPEFTSRRKITLALFASTFIILIVGALPWGKFGINGFDYVGEQMAHYFPYIFGQTYDPITHKFIGNINMIGNWQLLEMGILFLLMATIVAFVNWNGEKKYFGKVLAGAGDFLGVAFIIALAGAIGVLLEETGIQVVLIQGVSTMSGSMSPPLFTLLLFLIFLLISAFIPSVSGFSRSVFPVVGPSLTGGPTAAMVNGSGMTVSGSVLTFSLTNGLINLVSPTAIGFIVGIQLTNVPLGQFYKKVWPLFIGLTLLSLIILVSGSMLPQSDFPLF